MIPGVCTGVDNPHNSDNRPIYYDEVALVLFARHNDTRYRIVIETTDGRRAVIADGMGHWLAEHLADGLIANGIRVWFWDAAHDDTNRHRTT